MLQLVTDTFSTDFLPGGPIAASGGGGVAASVARAAAATADTVVNAAAVRAANADVYGDAYVAAHEDGDADNGARDDDAKADGDFLGVALPEFSYLGLIGYMSKKQSLWSMVEPTLDQVIPSTPWAL
ncbi:hypothetical protein L6452_42108 [Arctium lappa]|uniref:Uncharacterized protein n=1 Tax=Arctium lappa TaxID=4217 RepID=A0ACB8XJ36_ARCLA|nr:hypothetical protein L6452_42108 [Arctium lappa]